MCNGLSLVRKTAEYGFGFPQQSPIKPINVAKLQGPGAQSVAMGIRSHDKMILLAGGKNAMRGALTKPQMGGDLSHAPFRAIG